ncbi:MAG: hypothetical protein GXN99_03160 [Candidatus Nanohaloarchaeota archaeon]|nr:hypothetical protein [Candidatus Nanohaloarchaeota archaeon]
MKKLLFSTLLTISGFVFVSCLDLGIDGGDDGTNDTPTATSKNYLFYKASVDFLNPNNLSTLNIETKPVIAYSSKGYANINKTDFSYTDGHAYELFYITEEDGDKASINGGKIYKVSLEIGDTTPTKTQVSSISDACFFADMFLNEPNPKSYFVVQTAGDDGSCGTSDDKKFFINSDMKSSTAPIDLTGIDEIIWSYSDGIFEDIKGFIVNNSSASEIQKCDTNLDNCQTLISYSSPPVNLVKDEKNNMMYICYNDEIYEMKGTDNTFTSTGVSCAGSTGYNEALDENNMYFIVYDSGSSKYILKKFSFSDKSVSTLYEFATSGSEPHMIGNTIESVIVFDSDNSRYAAINKTSGNYTALLEMGSSDNAVSIIYKNKVMWNYYDGNNEKYSMCYWADGDSSISCKENWWAIGKLTKTDGNFYFSFGWNEDNVRLTAYKFIVADNVTKDTCGNIYAVDPDDFNSLTKIGTLPNNYACEDVSSYFGNKLLISAENTAVSGDPLDIFLIDVDTPEIKQITNTDDKSEYAGKI